VSRMLIVNGCQRVAGKGFSSQRFRRIAVYSWSVNSNLALRDFAPVM
jgi:hypothetical protein